MSTSTAAERLKSKELQDYSLAVNEIFGPTWQGEGPSLGRLCAFIRLAGCNLQCSWCDTPYTWDWTGRNGHKYTVQDESHAMTVRTIQKALAPMITAMYSPMFVISGGEPMLQDSGIYALVRSLKDSAGEHFARWEIETNGTKIPDFPSDLVDQYNVSPKLPGSGNDPVFAYQEEALKWYIRTGRAIFKFVVAEPSRDLDAIQKIQQWCGIPSDKIWIMPEGTDYSDIIANSREMRDDILSLGYNFTTRLHILLWNNKRAV